MIPPPRRRVASSLLVVQAVGAIGIGVGLTGVLSQVPIGSSVGLLSDMRAVVIAALAILFACSAIVLWLRNSEGVAGAAITGEVIAGCASFIDALTGTTALHRGYMAIWGLAAVAVVVLLLPLIDTGVPPQNPASSTAPMVRVGLRSFLELERRDVIAVVGIFLLAFVIRFASPIFLPVLDHPLQGTQVAAWGVGYPYNAGECSDIPIPPAAPLPATATPSPAPPASDTVVVPTRQICGFVFDEIYFPVDAARDLHQPALTYFDPEPPLTKLFIAPSLQFFGFNTWAWRFSTVLFGSLLAAVMYLIALRLRRDRFFALVAGGLVCIDGLTLVESRIGVIDIIAIFWVALIYYAFLLHWQARTRSQWRATLYVLGAVIGLAFAAKLTALAPTILVMSLIGMRYIEPLVVRVVPWLRRLKTRRDIGPELWRQAGGRRAILHFGSAVMVAGLVFCFCWSRYLTIPQTYYVFTACDVATTGLVGDAKTDPPPTFRVGGVTLVNPVKAVTNIYSNMRAGITYHSMECHGHPYASHWTTWPILEHPVLFYYGGSNTDVNGGSGIASITNMGNPAIWWAGVLAMLFCAWRMLTGPLWWRLGVTCIGVVSLIAMIVLFEKAAASSPTVRVPLDGRFYLAFAGMAAFGAAATVSAVVGRRFVPAFIVMGYELAWLMWVPGNAQRVLFYYHALGMFLLMVLAIAYTLSAIRSIPWRTGGRLLSMAPLAYGLIAVMVAGFIFFYPVWTAQPIPASDRGMRIWTDSW